MIMLITLRHDYFYQREVNEEKVSRGVMLNKHLITFQHATNFTISQIMVWSHHFANATRSK